MVLHAVLRFMLLQQRHARERHMCMQSCITTFSHEEPSVAVPCNVTLHAASPPCRHLQHHHRFLHPAMQQG